MNITAYTIVILVLLAAFAGCLVPFIRLDNDKIEDEDDEDDEI